MKLYMLIIFISKSQFNDFQPFTSTSKQAETSIKQLKKIQWVELIAYIKKIIFNIPWWRRSAVGSRPRWPLVRPQAAARLCWHKLQLSLFDQSVCTCQELSSPGCGTSPCHRALLRLFSPKHPWAKTQKSPREPRALTRWTPWLLLLHSSLLRLLLLLLQNGFSCLHRWLRILEACFLIFNTVLG